jgi:hypothetical protein
LYGLLLPIFQQRRKQFAGFRQAFPFGYPLLVAAIIVLLGISLISFALRWTHIMSDREQARALLTLCSFLFLFPWVFWGDRILPYSTVSFRLSHDPTPDSQRWLPQRQELSKEVIKLGITAILSGLLGWLIGRKP